MPNRPFDTKGCTCMESFIRYLDPSKQIKPLRNMLCFNLCLCWPWVPGREQMVHQDDAFFLDSLDVKNYWSTLKRRRDSSPTSNGRRVTPRVQESITEHHIKDEPHSPENDIIENESCGECQSPLSMSTPERTERTTTPGVNTSATGGSLFETELRAFDDLLNEDKQDTIASRSTSLNNEQEISNPALEPTAPAANTRRRHGIVRRKVHF